MFCPMTSKPGFNYMYNYYRDDFYKMMEMAQKTEDKRTLELGRPFSVWSSNPKYNTQYIIRRTIRENENI